ncbi:hypothetical protein [Phaeocystidibacter marisrubri]|uniref:Lipoprotein n=1 Tax=Phaeocystidibacter marisrubri TaxID=1577780 RepID=A0A6L3ZFD2_9FLAO|nr:hypothetical protein [Phaeocystidibacter marisrubri]KAB2816430.1 hypothetical protein F8C82_12170 [Phaeocystidibacter marisrubri]GGH69022.1 hypothetical protein GCM10011318_09620 [Phaeocystidibacter marisrubri]
MKKFLSLSLVFASALLLTACFEIKQKINVNRNGSGEYTFVFGLGELGLMAKEAAQKKGEEVDIMKADKLELEDKVDLLNAEEGISGAKIWGDNEEMTINLSFKFEDIDALNRGAQIAFGDSTGPVQQTLFTARGNDKFTFHGFGFIIDQMGAKMGAEEDSSMVEMARMMLQDVSLTTEMTFTEVVDKTDNENVLLKGDRKGVVLQHYPFRAAEENNITSFTVELD